MAETTKIEWCDHTFNPWSGCTKVAEGCKFCYAEVNYSVKMRGVKWGPNGNRVLASDAMWKEPLKWNRQAEKAGERRRVFCASLADVFEDWQRPILDAKGNRPLVCRHCGEIRPHDATGCCRFSLNNYATMNDCRRRLFALIDATPSLDWLLLTKRPENVRRMTPDYSYHACVTGDCPHEFQRECDADTSKGYRDNVWLGTSIATQADADKNIPELLKCRDLSPVLFVSAEPLIEEVDLFIDGLCCLDCPACIDGTPDYETNVVECRQCDCTGKSDEAGIDWLIIGGESGRHARPCDVAWIRSLKQQAKAAGVACFIKQLGAKPYDTLPTEPYHCNDPKGGDWESWDTDLRVREFPAGEQR